jgi:hypothetical protein
MAQVLEAQDPPVVFYRSFHATRKGREPIKIPSLFRSDATRSFGNLVLAEFDFIAFEAS